MRALNRLGVPFPRTVPGRSQMPCLRAPLIGLQAGEAQGLQERFALHKDLICAATTDRR
jgi:hypothetical protein